MKLNKTLCSNGFSYNRLVIKKKILVYLGGAAIILISLNLFQFPTFEKPATAFAKPVHHVRRVNVPYLGESPPVEDFEPAIFWFGEVTPDNNYADVRMWYYDNYLKIMVNIIDRRLWYDGEANPEQVENWDSVSIVLDLSESDLSILSEKSFRFDEQLHWYEPDQDYQFAYVGGQGGWEAAEIPFSATGVWRGNGLNNELNDHGWQSTFEIPFSSLGLTEKPNHGTVWKLGVVIHDRDASSTTGIITKQYWPESMDQTAPSTWGDLHFGQVNGILPAAIPEEKITIRHDRNSLSVQDAHVGGHTICGDGKDVWSEWGTANYSGYSQINIQNQWDISDFPCFSKYYITIPLDEIPIGKIVMEAKLKLTMFGNAGGGQWGEPPDSFIVALLVSEDWDESTISWNNAPLALENISGTWVNPVQTSEQRIYSWDVRYAVAKAYSQEQPLRLALYSIDGERHTGKYFWSSDIPDRDAVHRPTLEVVYGYSCESPEVECHQAYLPLVIFGIE